MQFHIFDNEEFARTDVDSALPISMDTLPSIGKGAQSLVPAMNWREVIVRVGRLNREREFVSSVSS